MDLPFTTEQFLGVFRDYNLTVWPAQIAALLAATWCIALGLGGPAGSRLASILLALLWLWMGIVYHGIFFSRVNPAATIFAALFVLEALLIAYAGVVNRSLRFAAQRDPAGFGGGALIVYALVVYPVLGAVSAHAWPSAPTFGLPCPTTIFTLGMLLWSVPPLPRHLLVIPVLWSLLGATAAARFGIVEDLGLPIAALVATVLVVRARSSRREPIPH